jgi:hypothetical protein
MTMHRGPVGAARRRSMIAVPWPCAAAISTDVQGSASSGRLAHRSRLRLECPSDRRSIFKSTTKGCVSSWSLWASLLWWSL